MDTLTKENAITISYMLCFISSLLLLLYLTLKVNIFAELLGLCILFCTLCCISSCFITKKRPTKYKVHPVHSTYTVHSTYAVHSTY